VGHPGAAARIAAVLGEFLEPSDLDLRLAPDRIVLGKTSIRRWMRLRT